tara:strand:- start:4098 stop:4787 length:690 start_codon:yes stop_codon:yes gene_type:complete
MVSFNHVAKLTYFSENKRNKEFLKLFLSLSKSNNLIDVLNFIKDERFAENNSSIKLNYQNKEILIFKENFLIDIPESNPTTHTVDDFIFTIDYPHIVEHTCKPLHCIREIRSLNESFKFETIEDYNNIPITTYKKIEPKINKYIKDLHNILIYQVGDVKSRFILDIELIIKIIYLAWVVSFKHLVEERLFLMKEYNFTYEAFDSMSYFEARHYLKKGISIINERNNSKT